MVALCKKSIFSILSRIVEAVVTMICGYQQEILFLEWFLFVQYRGSEFIINNSQVLVFFKQYYSYLIAKIVFAQL